jgi:hypothetical protein
MHASCNKELKNKNKLEKLIAQINEIGDYDAKISNVNFHPNTVSDKQIQKLEVIFFLFFFLFHLC